MRFAAIAVAVGVALAQPPDPLFWGGLQPGRYGIGYRSYFALDVHRRFGPLKGPRPILVNVWYPAIANGGESFGNADYFQIPPLPQYPRFGHDLEIFLFDALADDLFGKKRADLNQEERAFFDALLLKRTLARRDATPAGGPHPVLLYHPGAAGSYEENSALCEYLASHGYVVMTTAFPSPDGKYVSNNYGGLKTSWEDLVFLLAQARTVGLGDPNNVGAFGHSMGAQYLLAWLGQRGAPMRAVVSLDTTLEYSPENFDGHRWLRKQLAGSTRSKIPILVAASADRNPRFSTWDSYFAHRTDLAVRYFRHADFLMHGSISRTFTREHNGEVRNNYDQLCRAIRAFFDAHLGHDMTSWQQLIAEGAAEFRLTQKAIPANPKR